VHISGYCYYPDKNTLQGSVSAHLRCYGMLGYLSARNLLMSQPVKEFWKPTSIWIS